MIGQRKLLSKINSFTIDTFPRSSLLIAEKGMGKHTLIKYINENILHLPLLDITETLSSELIDQIYRNPNPYIYIINLSDMTEKEQNIMLKFIEEPLNNSFIILLAENQSMVLDTIISRCVVFEFENYSKDELKTFVSDKDDTDLILSIVKSPGKLLTTNTQNIKDIIDTCEKIVSKLGQANYANTLSITNKINFKDSFDKFDFDIFMDSLSYLLFSTYLKTDSKVILEMYNLTRDQGKQLIDKRLNKEIFFNNYITKLWKVAKRI